MNYSQALQFLYSQKRLGIRPGLDAMRAILGRLGTPHLRFESILVAGTNGKGSTSAMLHSILAESGYSTGLYASPHALDFRERIKVNGEMISERDVALSVDEIIPLCRDIEITFFEWVTAIAFLHFDRAGVELAVVEVGMGGRWDATNALEPELSIITPVDYDHTEYLGETLRQIAREKGEIVREKGILLTSRQPEKVLAELREICRGRGAEIMEISQIFDAKILSMNLTGSLFDLSFKNNTMEGIRIIMSGRHQVENATLSIAAALRLWERGFEKISERSLYAGLEKADLKGRLDTVSVSPKLVLDAAHNPAAMKNLVTQIKELFEFSRCVFVLGIMGDKDIPLIINELYAIADEAIPVRLETDRAADPEVIAKILNERGVKTQQTDSVGEAIKVARERAGSNGLVCVTGSFFTVSEAYKALGIRV